MTKNKFFKAVRNLPKYTSFGSNADIHIIERYNNLINGGQVHDKAMMYSLSYGYSVMQELIQEDESDTAKLKVTANAIYELGESIFGIGKISQYF